MDQVLGPGYQQQSQNFQCFCSGVIPLNSNDLQIHISQCKPYQDRSHFYKDFQRLNINQLNSAQLRVVKEEFNYYLSLITQTEQMALYRPQKNNPYSSSIFDTGHLNQYDLSKCSACIKPKQQSDICYFECCFKPLCYRCIRLSIEKEFEIQGTVKCPNPICGREIPQEPIKVSTQSFQQILGEKRYEELQQFFLERLCNIVTCVQCKFTASFEPGSQVGILRNPNTQQILESNFVEHYRQNRFVCLNATCKKEQCRQCRSTPYHYGMDCEQYKIKLTSKRCRFCDNILQVQPLGRIPAHQDVCQSSECVEKLKDACCKMLQCGHPCPGVINEIKCQPCLHPECSQLGDEYCNICFIDGLKAAPVIRAQCGHTFHYQCVIKKLETRWNGPRITFAFCLCSLCKTWLEFPPSRPQSYLFDYGRLLEDVKLKALERLKYEGRDKDDKVAKENGNYFGRHQEYAMAIYCYYQCFKCRKPYFGGAKDCQQALEDDKREFKPEELVCANCCEIPAGENCSIHGKEYIEFKCKFCCSIAAWFCWGTTHFCDECHKKQCNGDYVSKYPKEKLPKCPGAEKCPLKVAHRENGEEFPLGCAICRNQKANARNF